MKLRHPMSNALSLDDIFAENDDLGLLQDVIPAKQKKNVSSDPVVTNFLELIEFFKSAGREPDMNIQSEKPLAVRLNAYRLRSDLAAKVHDYDEFGFLGERNNAPLKREEPECEVTSLDDILNDDDDLGLLGDISTDIYKVEHVAPRSLGKPKDLPDEIARRKPCSDFYRFQRFFEQVQSVLGSDAVMLKKTIRETDVRVGNVFILSGILCYVESILKKGETKEGRDNPRMRVIFDNGTETNLLKLSLLKALLLDEHSKFVDFRPNLMSGKVANITKKDVPTGFIYILATESKAPELALPKSRNRLVKIGYTTQDVDERIRYAESDPTFLCAPVKKLAVISCFNLNPQKFENLIHAFLYKQRLNVTLKDADGQDYHPKEWFTVSLDTATEVCQRIIDGSIVLYRMDNTTGNIVKKKV